MFKKFNSKKFWRVFTYFVIAINVVSGIFYMFDGEFVHGLDRFIIAELFGVVIMQETLIEVLQGQLKRVVDHAFKGSKSISED